jgi:hypothetical protein
MDKALFVKGKMNTPKLFPEDQGRRRLSSAVQFYLYFLDKPIQIKSKVVDNNGPGGIPLNFGDTGIILFQSL